MSGAAILFVSLLCNSLFQTASQLRTQLQSATKRFLVTYRCIAKRYKALFNAHLMQLVPGLELIMGKFRQIFTEICLRHVHIFISGW